MKYIITIIILLDIPATTFAQFEYNSEGKIIPFSLSSKYKSLIDTSKVNTCMLPSYNNDSLYQEANFESIFIKKNYKSLKVGFPIDTAIDFKKVATKKELPNGIVWLYKIESKTAERLSIVFESFDIPEGALLSIYSSNTTAHHLNLRVYDKKKWDTLHPKGKLVNMVVGNAMFIEFFEPKNAKNETQIEICTLHYVFQDNIKKWLKNAPESLKKRYPNFDFERECWK